MEQAPKPFVVYWMSQVGFSNPSYTTPTYKPNMMTFETFEQANALHEKLVALIPQRGKYRTRIVIHVSPVSRFLESPAEKETTEAIRKNALRHARVQAARDFNTQSIIGRLVRADHPITCLNPSEWFEVVDARFEDGHLFVIGDSTCWFNLRDCDIKEQE